MKTYKCPICYKETKCEDNIIMCICHSCQEAMEKIKLKENMSYEQRAI